MAEIRSIKSGYEDDANLLLEQAQNRGFEAVMVVGFKGDEVMTSYSKAISRVRFLGALEEMKFRYLNDVYNS